MCIRDRPYVVHLPSAADPSVTASTAVRFEPAVASEVSANVCNQSSSPLQGSSHDIDFAIHPVVIDAATGTDPLQVDLTSSPKT